MRKAAGFALALVGCAACTPAPRMISVADALALPQPEPDQRTSYGENSLQFGELRLPIGPGPHPVAVVIHGGCWLAEYDLGYMSSMAAALTGAGMATWSIEYRRVGDDGGGWPGTFHDVAAAADHLRYIASEHDLDLDRVVAVGHSAGGHLALWLAARQQLARDDHLRSTSPLPIAGVVTLAGIPDLADYASSEGCGAAVPELLGGDPAYHPARVRRTSPIELVPLGMPQILVVGQKDPIVPRSQADFYRATALEAGDDVTIAEVANAGHFDLIAPESKAWPKVRESILNIVKTER